MRVLVVEDNVLVALMIRNQLEQAGHAVVGTCASASDAWKTAAGAAPDCALVDIDLADGRTGCDLAARLTHELGIAVVFSTGQLDLALDCQDDAIGALVKPINPYTLVPVMAALERHRQGDEPDWPRDLTLFRRAQASG